VLSDSKIRKQYDAARTMYGFSRKVGRKADEGSFDYREYHAEYTNLSPEEQAQLVEEFRRKMKKAMIFGLVMLIVLPILTRRNHRFYIMNNGELVPV
jgi:hypothetical protein